MIETSTPIAPAPGVTMKVHSGDRMPSAAWATVSAGSEDGLPGPTVSGAGEVCAPVVSAGAASAAAVSAVEDSAAAVSTEADSAVSTFTFEEGSCHVKLIFSQ